MSCPSRKCVFLSPGTCLMKPNTRSKLLGLGLQKRKYSSYQDAVRVKKSRPNTLKVLIISTWILKIRMLLTVSSIFLSWKCSLSPGFLKVFSSISCLSGGSDIPQSKESLTGWEPGLVLSHLKCEPAVIWNMLKTGEKWFSVWLIN